MIRIAIAQWVTVVTAMLAAAFWLLSALVRTPQYVDTTVDEPGSILWIIRRQSKLSAIAAVFAAISVLGQGAAAFLDPSGSAETERNAASHTQSSPAKLQYPVGLGESRTVVRKLLGPPYSTSTAVWDEFPSSGVSAMFDGDGRVVKLSFTGPANVIQFPYIPSDRAIVRDLSGHSTEQDFRRAFGRAVSERQLSIGAQVWDENRNRLRSLSGVAVVWRQDGYVLEAQFVGEERGSRGNPYEKGTLSSFEIYRGL